MPSAVGVLWFGCLRLGTAPVWALGGAVRVHPYHPRSLLPRSQRSPRQLCHRSRKWTKSPWYASRSSVGGFEVLAVCAALKSSQSRYRLFCHF